MCCANLTRTKGRLARFLLLTTLACGLVFSCGSEEASDSAESALPATETTLVRERVAHWFSKGKLERAREVLAPLVATPEARAEDLIRAAAIEFGLSEVRLATAMLDRAEALQPDDPAVHFLRGQMARESGEFDKALLALRRAHELAPDDLPTRYVLGSTLLQLDVYDEAERYLQEVVEVGIENGGSWYVSALYSLERLLENDDRPEQAAILRKRRTELKAAGIDAVDSVRARVGTFGRIAPPEPKGSTIPAPNTRLAFERSVLELPSFSGALEIRAHDLDGDGRMDLLARTPSGIATALSSSDGWRELPPIRGAADLVRAFDLDNEPDSALELLALGDGKLRFYRLGEELEWLGIAIETPALEEGVADIEPLDFDHEGDIDLLLVGSFGARLWRNDGAWAATETLKGAFVDASELANLPSSGDFLWAVAEDFDGDNDVDLLMGGLQNFYLADSLRAGRFASAMQRFPRGTRFDYEPQLADVNGDGRCDIIYLGRRGSIAIQAPDLSFAEPRPLVGLGAETSAVDLDLDGSLDLVWGSNALLAVGETTQVGITLGAVPPALGSQCILDANGDGKLDLVRAAAHNVELYSASGPRGKSIPIVVRGNKSNKRGVGSIVEVRTGPIYRRVYYRGETVLLGVGERDSIDVLRITYPNGSTLSRLDVPLESGELIDDPSAALGEFQEPESLIGSCPFLYTWNGERFEFITDVLGITPLGLPMAPGMMVPPDHDEFVLIKGEQLKVQDGLYKLQLTEELREVTYLDRVRLDVVDHPLGTEVYPNERFSFPPFPVQHLHTVEQPSALVKATGSDGGDWTAALARVDERHALAFTKRLPQFQGLAEPWFLDLEFDPAAIRRARKLRLVMTGWFFWSDASANMAAARTPGVDFIPPMILVPDGEGGWRETGPPIGFPAGKTKTMIVDLEGLLSEASPRIRLFSSLQLFWDRIVLATDGDDAPRRVTSLEAQFAVLSRRGFSESIATDNPELPERFEWGRIADQPRWNPHPGRYTKLGDCLPLLGSVDDRFVIMGTGEALELHFDASSLPPLEEGDRRDYFLYLDGWAKDRDHNTLEALEVEPLPFHGMSGYPYGRDEHFPSDPEHLEWRALWNTRAAKKWIRSLAPN